MQDIVLKKGKEKSLLRRHPWVYDTAVAKAGQKGVKIAAGEMVRVVSHDGRELGYGGWSPASTLRVRMFTYAGEEAPQPGFLTHRIEKRLPRELIYWNVPMPADWSLLRPTAFRGWWPICTVIGW